MIGESAFNFLAMADPFAGTLEGLLPGSTSRLEQGNMTNQQVQVLRLLICPDVDK